jgi:hypothetical protein
MALSGDWKRREGRCRERDNLQSVGLENKRIKLNWLGKGQIAIKYNKKFKKLI